MKFIPSIINASVSRHIPRDTYFSAELEIEAKDHGEDEEEKFRLMANNGTPMSLPGFFDKVVVDLSGVKFAASKLPVIADHDTRLRIGHTIAQAIVQAGQKETVEGREIKGPMIAAVGVVSSTMGAAKGFVADARKGFPFQVSIGAEILKASFVEEGNSIEVNGRSFKGPLIVAHSVLLREFTITVLGADNKTSAKLAASSTRRITLMDPLLLAYIESLGLDPNTVKDDVLPKLEAAWKASQQPEPTIPVPASTLPGGGGPDPTLPVPLIPVPAIQATATALVEQQRAVMADESERVGLINAAASRFGTLVEVTGDDGKKLPLATVQANAIRHGWTPEKFELQCHRSTLPSENDDEFRDGIPTHFRIANNEVDPEVLEASILRYGNTPELEKNKITGKEYGLRAMLGNGNRQKADEILEKSHQKQYEFNGSIQALLDMQIRAAGGHFHGLNRNSTEFLAAAVDAWNKVRASGVSTISVTNILENTMHKSALASFDAVEVIWPFITGRQSLNDFRPHNLYKLDHSGAYRQVATDGELKHVSMVDSKFSLQADTFGAMITIDRKTIKNDDLSIILNQARDLGTLGAQRIEESIFVLLLSNPGSFYAAGNNNLITGAGSVLSITSLNTAKQSFRDQVVNGKPVGISPTILLVGTALETVADQLWSEARLSATGSTDDLIFDNNPHKGMYRPYVSPYLNNTSVLDQDFGAIAGQTATQWYLFGNPNLPQGSSLRIGFIDNRSTPHFAESATQFNIPDGMQFRSYLDWGVAMHIIELSLKSAGA